MNSFMSKLGVTLLFLTVLTKIDGEKTPGESETILRHKNYKNKVSVGDRLAPSLLTFYIYIVVVILRPCSLSSLICRPS